MATDLLPDIGPAKAEAGTLDVPVLGMHCVACAARIEKALSGHLA